MEKIKQIIDELRKTNSSKEKTEILMRNKENELLKNILCYTYDPFRKYGISEKILEKYMELTDESYLTCENLFVFLDRIASENSSDKVKNELAARVKFLRYQDVVKGIILKDLKIGLSSTTINKVWKNLIPKFEVQLAKKYSDVTLDENELIFITEKFDGIRCVAIRTENDVRFYTRQGKEIFGLNEIKNELMELCHYNIVFDGELLSENPDGLDSGDLYRKTTKIVNSKLEDKKGVIFNVFDAIPLDEFKNGKSKDKYETRRKFLETILFEQKMVQLVPLLFSGCDHSVIPKLLSEIEIRGKEGLMINRNEVYECKRTKSLLKVKTMNTCDLEVIGYKQGTGRNKGKLGALVVDYKGNSVDVGSGFSDDEREKYWSIKESIIGRVVEVQYFEESRNEQGMLSLRFPVFKELREIGKEVSYN